MSQKGVSIGDIIIHRIVEQGAGTRPAYEFIAGLTRDVLEANRHWLEPGALLPGTDELAFCFQSYLVRTPHHLILVDSCIGNDKPRPRRLAWHYKRDDFFMAALAEAGAAVEDIDFVLCTHLHADHVGWNTRLVDGRFVPTFPNARYVMSETELAHWTQEHARQPIECIADSVLPIVNAGRAELVKSDHAIGDHVRLLPTPGHTIDHFAVRLGRERDLAVMTGDLIHSPLQARYPELCAQVDHDHLQAARTRRDFLARYATPDTLCCTAHFPAPSYGHFSAWDGGFRFVPLA
jgi:glyoxylase-like metal-dependent hydrolase (beta-lactamase superfamily II)